MRKLLLPLMAVLALNLSSAQEIIKTEAPIYDSNGITIENFSSKGELILLFRNAEYEYLIDYESVVFDNYDGLVLFINKIIEMLELPKTNKDEDLMVEINEVSLVRYGFAQGAVYMYSEDGYKPVFKSQARKMLESLKKL